MKILVNSLVIVSAAGVGLAVGLALRGKPEKVSNSIDSPAVVSSSLAGNAPRSFSRRNAVRFNDDSPLATKLESDLSMSSGVTRWLYWIEAIEKAGPADFPRLIRLAQGNSTARRFVAARWVEIAPSHLFDTIAAASKSGGLPVDELGNVLFEEWPKRDPDAAIAALNGTNDFGRRSSWRMQAATAVFDKDVERGLLLMSEWRIENYGPRMTAVAKWAAANPQHAAEFTFENPVGYAAQLMMETIGKEWAKTDPARALEFASAKPGELGSRLATSVLKEWAGRNLNEAGEWLAGVDDRTRNRLSPTFVEAWAKQDVQGAFDWCVENLTGSFLATAVGSVLKGAAEKDVVGAARLVEAMEPSQARAEAALAVAQKWFPEHFSDKPVKPETIAWLARLDDDSLKKVLDQMHWRWSASAATSMAEFLASVRTEAVPEYAYSTLARHMARKNPAEALEWAARLPADRSETTGSTAFTEWRRSQPEAAMKWLKGLKPDDPRREPFFQNAIRELAYDPRAAAQLASMSPSDRAAARSVIETMNHLPEDRRARLLNTLKAR